MSVPLQLSFTLPDSGRHQFLCPRLAKPVVRHSLRESKAAPQPQRRSRVVRTRAAGNSDALQSFVQTSKTSRLQHLEEQALSALSHAVDNYGNVVFPCALITGDVVILDLLHRLGHLESGRVPVIFIDTFHLFPETHSFLHSLEAKYKFKARVFKPAGFETKKDYTAKHGSDLFITNVDEYDRICKVEPFQRSLKELGTDVMLNGRRRDHGAERAHLEVFEAGKPLKCNPLAYWEFRDCWDYVEANKLEYHPLHDQGFPSIGDEQSTVPVPKEKWFEYGGERSGRFQNMTNADGSAKTECGIHVMSDATSEKGPAAELASAIR